MNEGDFNETVHVTVRIANESWSMLIEEHNYSLDARESKTYYDEWDTSGLAPGAYTITVNASIPEDAHPEDNKRTREVMLVRDILCYYCCLEGDCCHVSTIELLKAADDWSKNIAPPGFDKPLTTTQLLQLADWWSKNATTPCC